MNHLNLADLDLPANQDSEPKGPLKSPTNGSLFPDPDTKFASSDLGTDFLKPDKNYPESESDLDGHKKVIQEIESEGKINLIRQIKELQSEITEMNKRILDTEEEMKEKDLETLELKELLVKLKQDQGIVLETSEKESICKSCEVF
jgi:TolA-binding protein